MVQARALLAQDGDLMSQGDELELQRESTTNLEREQGTEGGQKREHADDGMAVAQETLHLFAVSRFEKAQERLIGSIGRECLDHIVVFGEAHLRRIRAACAGYNNKLRTHLFLDKALLSGRARRPRNASDCRWC